MLGFHRSIVEERIDMSEVLCNVARPELLSGEEVYQWCVFNDIVRDFSQNSFIIAPIIRVVLALCPRMLPATIFL